MSIDLFESVASGLRAGSPWDGLLSTISESYLSVPRVNESASLSPVISRSPLVVPRLVPEVEEGNVEYKLRLLHPSPERFARLVTQLKWRLLSGSGQAYYELGVADSGALVGLSRKHLEESLMTLEEMAGEIGASVIVVKEIELPSALFATTQLQAQSDGIGVQYIPKSNTPASAQDGFGLSLSTGGDSSTTSDGDEETELPTPEDRLPSALRNRYLASDYHPSLPFSERESPHDSPTLAQSLSGKSLTQTRGFANASESVDVNPEFIDPLDYCDARLKLEISTVYKPRPGRRRPMFTGVSALGCVNTLYTSRSPPLDIPPAEPGTHKKANRHKRKSTLHTRWPRSVINTSSNEALPNYTDTITTACADSDTRTLDDLEEAAALFGAFSFHDESDQDLEIFSNHTNVANDKDEQIGIGLHIEVEGDVGFVRKGPGLVSADAFHRGQLIVEDVTEKRFIVEAVVVRKMSVDDTSLDFLAI